VSAITQRFLVYDFNCSSDVSAAPSHDQDPVSRSEPLVSAVAAAVASSRTTGRGSCDLERRSGNVVSDASGLAGSIGKVPPFG